MQVTPRSSPASPGTRGVTRQRTLAAYCDMHTPYVVAYPTNPRVESADVIIWEEKKKTP